jgi:uncharacterized protein YchJ
MRERPFARATFSKSCGASGKMLARHDRQGRLSYWYSQNLEGRIRSCATRHSRKARAFEVTSKRRKGFPSEASVKRGERVVHGDKELSEKLGRNDPCPCGSGRRFQELLPDERPLRRFDT